MEVPLGPDNLARREDRMARRSATEPSPSIDTLYFRHPAWTILPYLALGAYGIYAVYRGAHFPDVFTPKGILFMGIAGGGVLFVGWLAAHVWWTSTDLTLTSTHLIAVHRFRQCRVELTWASIVRVRKTRSWVGLSLSRIETTDGRATRVGVHLTDYGRFLKELQARAVNCQDFDPYLSEFDSYWRRKRRA